MSHRKDIERAIMGKPYRNYNLAQMYFTCAKCHTVMVALAVPQHIKTCQQGKAECNKCHQWISADDFLEHYRSCTPVNQIKSSVNR